jgi:1,4-alpha-glucan branching enzyme
MAHPILYEINTRCWLHELSARTGKRVTLGSVPESEIRTWETLGFSHIWLMGVWETGPQARQASLDSPTLCQACRDALPDFTPEDLVGSPYAVARYRVSRDLGGASGLKRFRRQLERRGLGLVLDFVPNHLGLDHDWVQSHPQRFVASSTPAPGTFQPKGLAAAPWLAHGRDPNFPPWVDTVQLDYRLADTRAAMIAELQQVLEHCDGVRCDLAMLVLNDVFEATWKDFPVEASAPAREFWAEAIALAKQPHPDRLFLAEAYWDLEAVLQNLGFDYTYDKRLYDRVVARDYADVQRHLLAQPAAVTAASAHFLENHDEIRISALLSPSEHRCAAWLMLGLPGLRLIHEGQRQGACLRTPVQLARRWPEAVQAQVESLYKELCGALRRSAVGTGEAHLLAPRPAWPDNPTWQNLVLIQWQVLPRAFDVVVVNLAPYRSQGYAPLLIPHLTRFNWRMQDLLGTESYERVGDDLHNQGLYLDAPPHAAQLFHFTPV